MMKEIGAGLASIEGGGKRVKPSTPTRQWLIFGKEGGGVKEAGKG